MSIKPINPGNHPIKGLNECDTISPLQENLNNDRINSQCSNDKEPSLNDVTGPETSWLEECASKKQGIGHQANCDPMQSGQIVNDVQSPNHDVIYRYPKSIRGTDEAMQDLFRNLVVIDEDGKAHPVPIIWGTQERAVQYMLADNVRKDNSLVVDRIRLPLLAIHSTDIAFDENRYVYHRALDYLRYTRSDGKPGFTTKERYERDTVFGVARGIPVNISYVLYAWTLYIEDMDQILEQIMLKFSPFAYIRVRGVNWEILVSKDGTANNIDLEPGDQNLRMIKYQFNLTAQTYILQPIVRKKAVLDAKTEFCNKDMDEILGRLETAVSEFENDRD